MATIFRVTDAGFIIQFDCFVFSLTWEEVEEGEFSYLLSQHQN